MHNKQFACICLNPYIRRERLQLQPLQPLQPLQVLIPIFAGKGYNATATVTPVNNLS